MGPKKKKIVPALKERTVWKGEMISTQNFNTERVVTVSERSQELLRLGGGQERLHEGGVSEPSVGGGIGF